MSKRLIAALLGAGALAVTTVTAGVQGADAAAPRLTHMSGLHAQRVCAKATTGHAACFAKVLVNKKGAIPMATSPLASALTPAQLRAAYNLNGRSGARPYRRHRRCLRLPEPRARSRRLPQPVRHAGLHPGERLPEDHRPERRHQPAADQRRLGAGAGARRGCGVRGLPRLQDRDGADQDQRLHQPRPGRQHRVEAGRRRRDLQQLRRRGRGGLDVRDVLQPPGHRGDGLDR